MSPEVLPVQALDSIFWQQGPVLVGMTFLLILGNTLDGRRGRRHSQLIDMTKRRREFLARQAPSFYAVHSKSSHSIEFQFYKDSILIKSQV